MADIAIITKVWSTAVDLQNPEVEELISEGDLNDIIVFTVNSLVTTSNTHLSAVNPHAVTAEQVGADPLGSAAAVQANLNLHTTNYTNPHGVTLLQLGGEPALGNPTSDGQVLSSTIAGVRSWIDDPYGYWIINNSVTGSDYEKITTQTPVDFVGTGDVGVHVSGEGTPSDHVEVLMSHATYSTSAGEVAQGRYVTAITHTNNGHTLTYSTEFLEINNAHDLELVVLPYTNETGTPGGHDECMEVMFEDPIPGNYLKWNGTKWNNSWLQATMMSFDWLTYCNQMTSSDVGTIMGNSNDNNLPYYWTGTEWIGLTPTQQTAPVAPADLSASPTKEEVQAILDFAKEINQKLIASGVFQ